MKTTGNTILITGGGSGIGLALAQTFVNKGNKVIICGSNADKLTKAKAELPALTTYQVDLRDDAEIIKFADTLKKDHSEVNVVIHNAALANTDNFLDADSDFSSTKNQVQVNLLAPLLLSHKLIPVLRQKKNSAIIFISSGIGYVPMAGAPVYSATKAAIHSVSQSLREQLSKTGIEVYEVVPPLVDTDMAKGFNMEKMSTKDFVAETIKQIEKGKYEIPVGMAGMMKMMSRLNPSFAFKMVNNMANK